MDAVMESSSQMPSLPQGRDLEKKIRDRSAKVGVVGLGYVGLSLAVEMAKERFQVKGIDIDAARVNAVNAGTSYNLDVPSEMLFSLVSQERLKATQALATMEDLDALSICVPTPLRKTKEPDLSYVIAAIEAVRNHLRPGQLIVLESTTYPGTTRELVLPILEETGLQVGEDFFLAYSPERVDPGNPTYNSRNIPKIISGITPRCTELAALFYGEFIEKIIPVASAEAAEMVKLLENTFRSVNIALANEMALLSHKLGINVWEVIEAAQTKPFGFMAFYPGPGLGGHCIPVDPHYLTWKARMNGFHPRLIELATDINSQMPTFTIERIVDALNERRMSLKGSTILALGVAYKRDSNDLRESPATEVMRGLRQKGATIYYSDPYVSSVEIAGETLKSLHLTVDVVESMDCAVLLTNHADFNYGMIAAHSALILDSRNGFKDFSSPNIIRL
ncbi:MAG: nucleotide sugar dehydrogenase [Candidatus Binatia bacterium]